MATPELLKMFQQDPRMHQQQQQQQQQGPPPPEPDGELLKEQVVDMLARLLDQVQSPDIEVASTELANLTSTETLQGCLPSEASEAFVSRARGALEQLLKQRPSTVRKGLLQLAEAVISLAEDAEARCGAGAGGAGRAAELARQLEASARQKALIEYKKMEVLKVAGADIRHKLNAYAFVWKVCHDVADARALGKALGELLMTHAEGRKGGQGAEL
mmetsp:Transcript_153299/g.471612  ORF Transcript_153299/g.471612 Transcript_153299/m.471612 type:complete len:216 (+) Transcript_153299:1-648(+)